MVGNHLRGERLPQGADEIRNGGVGRINQVNWVKAREQEKSVQVARNRTVNVHFVGSIMGNKVRHTVLGL